MTGFSDTLAAYHDGGGEGRPEKYESQEKAWGNKGGLPSVWGQKSKLYDVERQHVPGDLYRRYLRWYHGKWW